MNKKRVSVALKLSNIWVYSGVEIPIGLIAVPIVCLYMWFWNDPIAEKLIPWVFVSYISFCIVSRLIIKNGRSIFIIPTAILSIVVGSVFFKRFLVFSDWYEAREISSEREIKRNDAAEKLRIEEEASGLRPIHNPVKAASNQPYSYDGKTFLFRRMPFHTPFYIYKKMNEASIRSIAINCGSDAPYKECLRDIIGDRVACLGEYGHKPDFPNHGKGNWIQFGYPVLDVGTIDSKNTIKIDQKNKITIKSNCNGVVNNIVINKSQEINIDGLTIIASNASAIELGDREFNNVNIRLSNLDLSGYRMSKHGINIGEHNKNIAIEKIKIRSFLYQGIIIKSKVTGVSIDQATVDHNERNGIVINADSEVTVKNSIFAGNGRLGLSDRSAGFGIFIQNNFMGLKKGNIQLLNNKILFNVGSLDQRLDSDIEGVELISNSQNNSTTYGIEGAGFTKRNISEVTDTPQKAKDLIVRSGQRNSKFLQKYADIIQLSLIDYGLSSDNFTYLREKQMDKCVDQLGEDGKKIVAKLLYALIGQDPHNIANFLNRSGMADRGIELSTSPTICREF